MKTKHTPGPWILDEDHEVVVDEQGNCIAMWATDSGAPITPGDLKLIAAAPDLLKACMDLIDQVEKVDYKTVDGLHDLIKNLAIKSMIEAIEKATK